MTERTADTALPLPTPYERIGGEEALTGLVDRFYDRVLADPALAAFFTGTPMERLKCHQRALFTQLLGGPQGYEGRELGAAHQGLGITDADYARVVDHLVAACRELSVPEDVIASVGETLGTVRGDIVSA